MKPFPLFLPNPINRIAGLIAGLHIIVPVPEQMPLTNAVNPLTKPAWRAAQGCRRFSGQ
jgi:hypothetical protein